MLKLILLTLALVMVYRYWKARSRQQQLQNNRRDSPNRKGTQRPGRKIVEADFKDIEE